MKEAHFWVVLVVAALVVPAAFSLSLSGGKVRTDCTFVSDFTQVVKNTTLSELSESAALSSANAAGEQTDNSTATATSSGAVKASFTVVAGPASNQGEGGMPSTGSVGRDSNYTSSTAPAQVTIGVAVDDQSMQNNQLGIAAGIRPKSSDLLTRWPFFLAAWLLGIAVGFGSGLLLVRVRK